jgi:putative FmdB family regulatory protein
MPIYNYKCTKCSKESELLVSYDKRNGQKCADCNEELELKPSYRFNATGLPNGFHKNRGDKRI